MMRCFALLALVSIVLPPAAFAQTWSWAYATANTEGGRGGGAAVAVDAAGNSYVIGTFQETMSVGAAMLAAQGEDAFVFKLDPAGNPIWALQIGGAGRDTGGDIGIAPDGAVYVIGQFEATASVGGMEITSAGSSDAYVAKLTSEGTVVWARALGGIEFESGVALGIGADDAVYVTGSFVNTTVIGGTSLPSAGSGDLYLARLDGSGNVTWAVSAGGTGSDLALALAANAAGPALVGRFETTAAFGTESVTSAGAGDAFVARYDADGTALWATSGGNPTSNDYGYGVDFTSDGDIIAVGEFSETATFSGTSLTSAGSADGFVARFGDDGALVWINALGGTEYDSASDVAVGEADAITITGGFRGSATMGTTTLTSAGAGDVFFTRYASDGTADWAVRAGGPGTAGFSERAGGLAAAGGGVVATGSFYEEADFGPFMLSATPQNHSGVYVVGLDRVAVASETSPLTSTLVLSAPHPNPTAGPVAFALTVPAPQAVRAEVFDILGRRVALVYDGRTADTAPLRFDTSALRPGLYVLRVTAGSARIARRFTVVR